jgi:hypothetical protein
LGETHARHQRNFRGYFCPQWCQGYRANNPRGGMTEQECMAPERRSPERTGWKQEAATIQGAGDMQLAHA